LADPDIAAHDNGRAYTHAQLNALFMSAGFPGNAPEGNKSEKCRVWLRNGNQDLAEPLEAFGKLIAEMMDVEHAPASAFSWSEPPPILRPILATKFVPYSPGRG
jgi:hypothetical protein